MTPDEKDLQALGQQVRDELGAPPAGARQVTQRQALLDSVSGGRSRSPEGRPRVGLRLGLGLAAAAALLLVGAGVLLVTGLGRGDDQELPGAAAQQQVTVTIGTRQFRAPAGTWIAAPADRAARLHFSGKSRMELAPGGRAVITALEPGRVAVRLNQGALGSDVDRRRAHRWEVNAGPYGVQVLGTAFLVRWEPDERQLRVEVTRGKVKVVGELLPNNELVLVANQRLDVDRANKTYRVSRLHGGTSVSSASAGSQLTLRHAMNVDPAVPPAAVMSAPPSRPTPVSGLRQLLSGGKHRAAVRVAERLGIPRLSRTLPRQDLWRLARACRFAHKGQHAVTVLQAYRRRFAGTGQAHTAAFLLGRVHLEQLGRPAAAARWFGQYLKQSPRGALAPEAHGRLVDALRRAGQTTRARAAAKRYLTRYPRGIYRRLAQSVLSK